MVFRFKIWFENDDEVIRWIDIKPSSSFLDFHNAIQDAIGFDKKELASFYVSDTQWKKHMEITLENMFDDEDMDSETAMPSPVMSQTKLREWINDPHQRFIYVSDYVAQWTLFIELQSIQDPRADASYPLLVKSEGKAPRQREDSKFKMLDDNEFDALAAKILAAKGIKDELMMDAE
ncbi:MAG: IS1096 element passenger TnpR family protein [Bacteroidia bacterium]